MGRMYGTPARSGRVKNYTPHVEKKEKPKKLTGRAKLRKKYNSSLSHNPQNFSINSHYTQEKRKQQKDKHHIKYTKSIQPYRGNPKKYSSYEPPATSKSNPPLLILKNIENDQVSGRLSSKRLRWISLNTKELVSGSLCVPRYVRSKKQNKELSLSISREYKVRTHFQDTNRKWDNLIRTEMIMKKNLKMICNG
uniref:Uncharacterized protein n=1 Tax=Arcella intermedia TaxID=1963864 RepID=A0A6B2LJF3_9EUKA|eukprot:TRINITY_DN24849_c0_g1_i1.p1 TRINITY_DN24849_c0_g1~~TRINITY_DN24849_c0_g1_i1.p1  ORF type:complete len:194 (-),score=48.73 TRINITY_DN24849_c0_g1_i1:76-657(-)